MATALGWSTSKLSRYELGEGLKPAQVTALLDHYRVPSPQHENLLALAHDAAQKGWWEDYSDVSSADFREFIGLEDEASSISIWHLDLVTGLLQTERYAYSILSQYSQIEPTAPAIIERRLHVRMQRQRILLRDPPPGLVVVLDESVLLRQIGDESVMYEQLQRLALEAERPHVTLRILPLSVKHAVPANSFVLFRFAPEGDSALHDVVETEGLKANFYVEGQQETFLHRLVFDTLLDASLDAAASKELIIDTARTRWRGD